ncbi:MAG: HAD family hydrolase [Deltaproteobacteria bacterium]|nr:HAD family hydrolase [Deltaproteobacteria bacterium]
MNSAYKVIAFDCDGVMFDTSTANRAYYNTLLKSQGMPPVTDEQFAYVHAHTVDQSVAFLFQDAKKVARAQEQRQKMSYLPFVKEMAMEPNLLPLLGKLRGRYWTAIATNRTDTMDRVLENHDLKSYFDLVVTASDVARPKPDPEGLFKIARHFNVQAAAILYIGDSEVDAVAASSAGVTFAAYGNRALSASYHIETLKDLETILK